MQDAIGGPPWVAVAEKDGMVVAVRLHGGSGDDEEDTEDGPEGGYESWPL